MIGVAAASFLAARATGMFEALGMSAVGRPGSSSYPIPGNPCINPRLNSMNQSVSGSLLYRERLVAADFTRRGVGDRRRQVRLPWPVRLGRQRHQDHHVGLLGIGMLAWEIRLPDLGHPPRVADLSADTLAGTCPMEESLDR
jgi:hypothetical protein